MKKSFSIGLFWIGMAQAFLSWNAYAQNWTTVTATNITDLNQQKLAAGQLCFMGTDQNDVPISFNVGGGGQLLRRLFCSAVSSGAVTAFTVPNPAQTAPAGIFYRVTVRDTSTGLEVLRYTQVTFNGATFNFDNYAPLNIGQVSPPAGTAVNGNLSVNGNLTITGLFSAGSFGLLGVTGLGINTAANNNAVNGPSGWTIQAGGTPEITVNSSGATINTPTFTGNVTMPASATATSGANFGTALQSWNGSYWNGSSASSDSWTAQSFLPAGTNPANSFLIFNHTGTPGSFFQVNSNLQLPATTAATSGSNVNSPFLSVLGNYWTGSASNSDSWGLQDVLGSGANPTSTLSLSHLGGSTGATTVDVSSVGTLKTGAINAGTNTVTGSIFQIPGAANLQIDTNRFGALGVRVQSIGTNAVQALTVMPSGTANETTFRLHNSSDPLNTGALQFDLTGTNASIAGVNFGTGSAPSMLTLSGLGLQVGASDTGLSRTAAGVVAAGNGTAGNTSGTFEGRKLQLDGSTSGNTVLQSAAAASGTLTLPAATDTLVGRATTDTLTNKTLTGAGSGNSTTLLNSQDTLAAVAGNGTDQTLYTFTIPANTVQAGKGIRLTAYILNNNAVAPTYKVTLGATSLALTPSAFANNIQMFRIEMFNNSGVQNAQVWTTYVVDSSTILNTGIVTSTENFANAVTLKITANEANPNAVTPKKWIVELIQ
jgi:hypothetical protein